MAQAEEAAGEAAPTPKKKSKLLVVALAGVVVLALAGLGGAWAAGVFGGGEDEAAAAGDTAEGDTGADDTDAQATADGADGAAGGKPVFVDLPKMLVNLVSDSGTRFLKLSIAVEVDDPATAERIEQLSPRIVDSFQLYLRTLRPEELRGPGSMFRLKEDLHVRIHQAIEPATVRDVLFKEMLVQ